MNGERVLATFDEYNDRANPAHGNAASPIDPPTGWQSHKREWACWWGNGFQGAMFSNENEVVVAVSGTKGGLLTAPVSQNSADVRIRVNVIPDMAGGAYDLAKDARQLHPGKLVTLCGHSLGGPLTQVVGNWTGCPFISFNGPGMKTHPEMSAFSLFKPMQMLRSALSRRTTDTIGICFILKREFGTPVGWKVELPRRGEQDAFAAHGMNAVFNGLRALGWRMKTPRDAYSIWPKA